MKILYYIYTYLNYSVTSVDFHKFISTNIGCSAIAENLLSTIEFPSNATSENCDIMLQLQKLLQTVVNSHTSKAITTATSKPSRDIKTRHQFQTLYLNSRKTAITSVFILNFNFRQQDITNVTNVISTRSRNSSTNYDSNDHS